MLPSNSLDYVPMVNNFMNTDNYKAAGVAFTNGLHVLGGYQPHKKRPSISGIGGSREVGDKCYMHTALRECIEELFNPLYIPKSLLCKLVTSISPKKVIQTGDYINVIYSFEDLHLLLKLCKNHRLQSPYYKLLPRTVYELITSRIIVESAEITYLTLLPILSDVNDLPVSRQFLSDMKTFI